jgi:ribosomal protein S6--L-glutamate ligase
MPRTHYGLALDRQTLREQAAALGGYPLVFKVLGGQEGAGVMLVDSERALFSLADYFAARMPEILLMEFVPATSSARLVVVGDRVVASVEYVAPDGDFRSNIPYESDEDTVKRRIPKTFSQEAQDVAVRLARACGFEFGGVDLLLHEDKIYALEINMPCNFADTQEATGIDIADAMVSHLANKTQKFGSFE